MVRRALIAAFFGMGLVTVGCIGEGEEDLGQAQQLQGGGGFIGDNHYLPTEFQANLDGLRNAGWSSLASANPADHQVSANVLGYLPLTTEASRNMFELAVSCGLAAGDYVVHNSFPADPHSGGYYYGSGYLTTTAGWRNGVLTTSQAEDLFTCMITRLNPSGQHVKIMLGGASVAPSNGGDPDYTFVEAVWSAVIDSPRHVTLRVWPSPDLYGICGKDITKLTEALTGRTCPTPDGHCGVEIQTDLSSFPTGCKGSDMDWTCDGRPAIQTNLRPADLPVMYEKCMK